MASNGDEQTGTTDYGLKVSAGENRNITVDLNTVESDRAEDTPPSAAAFAGASATASTKDGGVWQVTTVSTAAYYAPVNDILKRIRRAERFGMPVQLSEEEKRYSRAERFGAATASSESETLKIAEELKRKARAERFGLPLSSAPHNDEAKKKARLARFGAYMKADSVEEEKRKARALRFSKPASNSSSQSNGKGNIGQVECEHFHSLTGFFLT